MLRACPDIAGEIWQGAKVERPPLAIRGFCCSWVASELGPFIPQQQTCCDCDGMSVWCQFRKRTHPFDHLVGARKFWKRISTDQTTL